MKSILLFGLLCVTVTGAHAQKKLTLVTKSALTGIGLPKDSKQDSRILSVAAAATLLEMESDKANTKLQNTEVLVLPPASLNKFNKDSLVKRITAQSWKITRNEDNNYLWLQKDKRVVIAYFAMNTKQTDLYLAEAISLQVPPTQGINTVSNQSSTQTIVQPATPPVNQATKSQNSQPISQATNNLSIVGSWGKSNNVSQVNNRFGTYSYIKYQYTFNSNGTYNFAGKNYSEQYDETLLTKESGTYMIDANKLTIIPQSSVIEAWSKKGGADNWNLLKSSQNRTLEKTTYQISVVERNLVLQTAKETERDGRFSNGNSYSYGPPETFTAIQLPGTEVPQNQKAETITPTLSTGFKFTSTNFDDGWVSTVQEDWIQVTKGNTKVLIHYPNKNADAYNSVLMDGLKNAWNILVAPKYSSASNFEFKPISSWQSIEFAEADAVEKTTGKSVHVILFKMNYSNGSGKYLEFITPDKKTFEQEFGPYHETSYGWEKVEAMANYNKFAVAATDLTGKWTNNFSGTQQYVNAYTGASAGMDTHSSNQNFEFSPQNTYKWDLSVASGFVGSIKFQSVKSSGQFSLPNNWQINFSDLEGKPKTYNAFFSCIKGFRILMLEDAGYPTGYTGYGKVE